MNTLTLNDWAMLDDCGSTHLLELSATDNDGRTWTCLWSCDLDDPSTFHPPMGSHMTHDDSWQLND